MNGKLSSDFDLRRWPLSQEQEENGYAMSQALAEYGRIWLSVAGASGIGKPKEIEN
jgi:hypothetical protein